MTARRRRQAWRVVRAAVPVAVIVAVGVGALVMLTGKPGTVLAGANRGDLTPTARSGATVHRATAPPTAPPTAFPGYPGQRGTVVVTSMASAAGVRLAVGSAGGHPAIWRQAASGTWTLVSAGSPAVYRHAGVQLLTSVAHGPSGWIAVGGVVSGTVQQSVVVTSANGVTWHAIDNLPVFTGKNSYVAAVTAGRAGYVVVGRHVTGRRSSAATWWSSNLRHWLRGASAGLNAGTGANVVIAVTAVPGGFVAVGTHGADGGIWTSANGRRWSIHHIRRPAGAASARFTRVAANGSRVVAAGYAVTKAGHIPVVAVSTNGGKQWRQVVLAAPGHLGTVTALTAAGPGFVAAGWAGPAGAQHAVAWSSANVLTWKTAAPVGAGEREVTALLAAGDTVTGIASQGVTPAVVTMRAP